MTAEPISTDELRAIANRDATIADRETIARAADELDALRSRVKELESRRGSLNSVQGINGIQR